MKRWLTLLFATAAIAGGLTLPAHAVLRAAPAAAVDANGFPLWFEDETGFRVGACTDVAMCAEGIAPPPFPDPLFELPFYMATATPVGKAGAAGATGVVILSIEGFPSEVVAPAVPTAIVQNAVVIDLRTLTPNGEYEVSVPYEFDHDLNPLTAKTNKLTVVADAGGRARGTFPLVAGTNATSPDAPITVFLRPANVNAQGVRSPRPFADPAPAGGPLFLSDALLEEEVFVSGSPIGQNFVTVIGPRNLPTAANQVNVKIEQFSLVGQLPEIHDHRAELQTRNGKVVVTGTSTLPAGTVLTVRAGPLATDPVLGTATVRAPVAGAQLGTFRMTASAPRTFPGAVTALRVEAPGVGAAFTITINQIR